jgi:hypothetical protein
LFYGHTVYIDLSRPEEIRTTNRHSVRYKSLTVPPYPSTRTPYFASASYKTPDLAMERPPYEPIEDHAPGVDNDANYPDIRQLVCRGLMCQRHPKFNEHSSTSCICSCLRNGDMLEMAVPMAFLVNCMQRPVHILACFLMPPLPLHQPLRLKIR